jgi:predicted transcriptional regulator
MDAEERTAQEGNSQRALLKAMIENAKGTQRDWAMKVGRSVSTIAKTLKKLEKEKLVRRILDKWQVAPAGQKAAEE